MDIIGHRNIRKTTVISHIYKHVPTKREQPLYGFSFSGLLRLVITKPKILFVMSILIWDHYTYTVCGTVVTNLAVTNKSSSIQLMFSFDELTNSDFLYNNCNRNALRTFCHNLFQLFPFFCTAYRTGGNGFHLTKHFYDL